MKEFSTHLRTALVMLGFGLASAGYSQNCNCGSSDWDYVVPIVIDNSANTFTLPDYQILVQFNSQVLINGGLMFADARDLRFTSDCNTQLNYWIETGLGQPQTYAWVKIPSIPAGAQDTIYMHYGNSNTSLPIVSDPLTTMDLYDDFAGNTLNAAKWTTSGGVSAVVAAGEVHLTGGSSGGNIQSVSGFPANPGYTYDAAWIGRVGSLTDQAVIIGFNHASTASIAFGIVAYHNSGSGSFYPFSNSSACSGTYTYDLSTHRFETYQDVKFAFDGVATPGCNPNGNTTRAAVTRGILNLDLYVDYMFVRKYAFQDPIITLLAERPSVPLVVSFASIDDSCYHGGRGATTANVTGNFTNLSYAWSGSGSTSNLASGIGAGIYTVTATDVNGCYIVGTDTIGEAAPIEAFVFQVRDPSCPGENDGRIEIGAFGGSAGGSFTYQWSPNVTVTTGEITDSLAAGSYFVTMTDDYGCTGADTFVLQDPAAMVLGFQTDSTTFGQSTGTATVSVTSGGTAPYTYQWDANAGNQTTATATGLAHTTYTVTVTDSLGCSIVGNVEVPTLAGVYNQFQGRFVVAPNPSQGRFLLQIEKEGLRLESLRVLSITGIRVWEKSFPRTGDRMNVEIDLSDFGPGLYFLEMRNDGKSFVRKLIVE